ncbi:MAG: LamG domain-containing protein [Myxococcota bacterium]
MGWRVFGACLLVFGSYGCTREPFGCEADDQCQSEGADGACEANGYCSFPDANCISGRRYGELAGGGLAGLCVNDVDPTSTSGGSSTTGSASTSGSMPGLTTVLTTTDDSQSTSTTDPGTTEASTAADDTSDASSSSTTGADPLETGLVVYVDFETDANEAGGYPSAVADGLDATCEPGTNCPELVEGPVGTAGSFDGIDDRLRVDDDTSLYFFEGYSLCLWSQRTGPFEGFGLLVGKAFQSGSSNSYELYVGNPNDETQTYRVWFSSDTGPENSGVVGEDVSNAWTHLCGVWDGELMRLYVDGEQVGVTAVESAPSYDGRPLLIGADIDNAVEDLYFPGNLDEVRVYNRALEPDEVSKLFAQGS